MRILVTNDDGINAPGLKVAEAIAAEIAGPEGEVWTVAPAFEQSGVAHKISYTHPMLIAKMDERRFAAEGSPADCVLAGYYEVLGGEKPDLVLSGVNRGNNAAENTLYSGTVGGAMEAALQGIPAIALSQYLGPQSADMDGGLFEPAVAHGTRVVRRLLDQGLWTEDDYRLFYNVNFPPVPADAVRGTRVTAQGFRRHTTFGVEPHNSPSGRRFLWIKGGPQHLRTLPGTDAEANLDGYISITPLTCDMTAHDRLGALRDALDETIEAKKAGK
ncbi:5'/3'-nucleotidase SurE [Pararhodobacter marinus]|uniref:5'-nucleotidase SurE n=1 Tax=Pararhodobacter marinus TaxID=2184063 RepID=A0A2U2C9T5_9RHOB|nr:5'/3'-nucleotidase SurE [Pararhodobacter marinus]PWE28637.1 5'/3'-nucleotidase SurE [Pararhodobacter marinus]